MSGQFYAVVFWFLFALGLSSCSSQQEDFAESAEADWPLVPVAPEILAARPSNLSCLAGPAPANSIKLQRVFEQVGLRNPVSMVQAPLGPDAPFYVAEKRGRIVAIPVDRSVSGVTNALQLNVLSEAESGITALAFHPAYAVNGRVFVGYGVELSAGQFGWRLSEFSRGEDGITFENERVLISYEKDNPLHLGGDLAFGPDGYLYISTGDDGDNLHEDANPLNAQDISSLKGKILRIDVDNIAESTNYSIPADNPIFNGMEPNEAWAIGFRNPWRISFDSEPPHALWNSNVGSSKFEEINIVERGGNYGWPMCEGPCELPDDNLIDPVHFYANHGGAAVIGGFVYRGAAIPELYGKYIFADYVHQTIGSIDMSLSPGEPQFAETILDASFSPSSFSLDNEGELYVLDYSSSRIYRLEPNQDVRSGGLPTFLSETGCFSSLENGLPVPAEGVQPYAINQQFWSDGATKSRLISLPDGLTIDTSDSSNWKIPVGAVTIKHFSLQDRIIETRFLVRHDEQQYGMYSYQWNDELSDAELVPAEGRIEEFNGLEWEYPSRSNCFRCHSEQAGYSLSLESRQLNMTFDDESEQIDILAAAGYLDNAVPEKARPFPTINQLSDEAIPLNERALSWLHVNCSSCHRGQGSAGRAEWDARYNTSLAQKRICEQSPFEAIGETPLLEALLAPGSHEHSTLWLRAGSRGTSYAMPPISSNIVDELGIDLIANWIDETAHPCPPIGEEIPGRIQAQNYTQAVDFSGGNEGPDSLCDRGDDTDLEPTSDLNGQCAVAFIAPGEWLSYDIFSRESGNYQLTLRVASGRSPNGSPATVSVRINDVVVVEEVEVPETGWNRYQNIEVPNLQIESGNHELVISFPDGFVNFNFLELRQAP